MAIVLDEDQPRRRLVATASGILTGEDVLQFLRTARASLDRQQWPLLFDARGVTTTLGEPDLAAAVGVVEAAMNRGEARAHVALVADDDVLYAWFLRYEMRCNEIGVRVIRTFRQRADAERWLEILSGARHYL